LQKKIGTSLLADTDFFFHHSGLGSNAAKPSIYFT